MHPFDEAIALKTIADNRYSGATHSAYANMVGPFGGITSAALVNAVMLHPQRLGEPIALTVNFAGPLADGPFQIEALPMRTNRSTQHWAVTLTQENTVCATGSLVLAKRRETWSAQESVYPSDMPAADTLQRAPCDEQLAWLRCYDMRFAPGEGLTQFDGIERTCSDTRMWIRDEPPRPLDFAALAAICDSFEPSVWTRRQKFVPIGTVTLSTYFHVDAALLAETSKRHVLLNTWAHNFCNGYFDQSANVWSDLGHLLASTHQMVYYRE